jgi:hypothetical protein
MAASHVKNKSNFTSCGGIFKTTRKQAAISGNRGKQAKKTAVQYQTTREKWWPCGDTGRRFALLRLKHA